MEAAFGERTKAMGAKFLKSVKLIVDPGDCHHQLVDFDPQRFSIAQLFGLRNGNKGRLSILGRVSGRKMKRALRSWRVSLVAPDRNYVEVYGAATQLDVLHM